MIPSGAIDAFAQVIITMTIIFISLLVLGLVEVIIGTIILVRMNKKKEKNTAKKVISIILIALGSSQLTVVLLWTLASLLMA